MAHKKRKHKPQDTEEILAACEEIAPAFSDDESSLEPSSPKEPNSKRKTIIIAATSALVGIALASGIAVGINGLQNQERITGLEGAQEIIAAQASEHVHTWIPQTETHHIDAVTETVVHPAVYEDVVVNHTVCNVCNTVIDGVAEEHKADTGHAYTVNVPITESHMKSAEWVETVIAEDARDETVTVGALCTSCGEVLNMDQVEARGISVSDAN